MKGLFAEQRRLFLFNNLGEDAKNYGNELNTKYLKGPWDRGDNIQKIGGPVMAGASVLLEGPDRLWASAMNQKLKTPNSIAGRIRRDVNELFTNLNPKDFHPLRAAGDAWRLGTSDWILDSGDVVLGTHAPAHHRSSKESESPLAA